MTVAAIIVHHARFLDTRFWKDYAVTMRPYLLFVSGITGVAGMSLAPRVPLGAFVLLGIVFFLAYGFGQALTDCFQTDTDSLSAPYRPLVRGTLHRRDVALVSLVGLTASAVLMMAFSPAAAVPAALTIVGLATYTWFKRRWWGGPWYNAWIVSLVALIGYQTAAGAAGGTAPVNLPLVGTMLAAFAGYANFVLTGYYKDIEADGATGYHTLPVVFGRRVSAYVSDGLAAAAFAGAALALAGTPWSPWTLAAVPFLLASALAALTAQIRLRAVHADREAHRAIEPVVHGYILLLAGLATAAHPAWAPFVLSFYLAFVWTVKHRPLDAQI